MKIKKGAENYLLNTVKIKKNFEIKRKIVRIP